MKTNFKGRDMEILNGLISQGFLKKEKVTLKEIIEIYKKSEEETRKIILKEIKYGKSNLNAKISELISFRVCYNCLNVYQVDGSFKCLSCNSRKKDFRRVVFLEELLELIKDD